MSADREGRRRRTGVVGRPGEVIAWFRARSLAAELLRAEGMPATRCEEELDAEHRRHEATMAELALAARGREPSPWIWAR